MALTSSEREVLLGRITPVADVERKFKMCLYSNPGVGKTVTAATIGGKSLMLMSEPGETVLTKPRHRHLVDQCSRVPFVSLKGIDGYTELLANGDIDADTFILDNASGIQDKVLASNHERLKTKLKREDPDLSTLQDYQIVAHQMREPVINLLNLDKNVIIICHARIPTDPKLIAAGETTRPDLTKYVFNLVNEKCDVVAYLHKGGKNNQERLVRTESTGSITAKSRITEEGLFTLDDFIQQVNNWKPNL